MNWECVTLDGLIFCKFVTLEVDTFCVNVTETFSGVVGSIAVRVSVGVK